MLPIHIPKTRLWDNGKEEFIYVEETTLELEHSLVSISKWESKWHKSFFDKRDKTYEETLHYIECMSIDPKVSPEVFLCLTDKHMEQIKDYIDNPMTASSVPEDKNSPVSKERITSELIYYWMISLQIPVEFEHWHINRLIMLIKICGVKNSAPKKTSMNERYNRHAAINAANRKRFNTKG